MNYRHAYHAGNFADVLKHLVLVHCLMALQRKPAPFRVIDTHAGVGLYDLGSEEALKTGEWRDGIGRILAGEIPPEAVAVLAPYLELVARLNGHTTASDLQEIGSYPGSPLIVQTMLREGDALIANELHPEDRERLEEVLARDSRVKVMGLDGFTALKSLLPPKERRGLVLVDPPFEEPGELDRMAAGLAAAVRRFATGTYVLWYPIKERAPVAAFHAKLRQTGLQKLLAVELLVRPDNDPHRLNGCGLVLHNPPYRLDEAMQAVLPFLAERLGREGAGKAQLSWLAGEARQGG